MFIKNKKLFSNLGILLFTATVTINATATTATTTATTVVATPVITTNGQQTTSAPIQQQAQPTTNQPQPLYCPLASQLTQDANTTWRAGKEWRGYEQTIVTEIQGFVGAQWTGVKIGKIICLYQGKQALDFPISLEQKFTSEKGDTLIKEPTSPNWSAQTQGYRFCKSTNVSDCPFYKPTNDQVATGKQLYDQIKYAPIKDNE